VNGLRSLLLDNTLSGISNIAIGQFILHHELIRITGLTEPVLNSNKALWHRAMLRQELGYRTSQPSDDAMFFASDNATCRFC
jgi:hypothetical protein